MLLYRPHVSHKEVLPTPCLCVLVSAHHFPFGRHLLCQVDEDVQPDEQQLVLPLRLHLFHGCAQRVGRHRTQTHVLLSTQTSPTIGDRRTHGGATSHEREPRGERTRTTTYFSQEIFLRLGAGKVRGRGEQASVRRLKGRLRLWLHHRGQGREGVSVGTAPTE